jgi:hypothetical protein
MPEVLKSFSNEELEAELKRRKQETQKIHPLETPDYNQLYKYIVSGLANAPNDRRLPKDFEHYVYELAMQAIYGKDVFKRVHELNLE